MLHLIRNIIIVALNTGYIAGTEAVVLQLLYFPATSSGTQVIKDSAGQGKEPRRPIWIQRRHLPLVSQLTISVAEPPCGIVPDRMDAFSNLPQPSCPLFPASDYFSSRCNKSPPLS